MNNYHRFLNLPFSVKNPTILKITDNIDSQASDRDWETKSFVSL